MNAGCRQVIFCGCTSGFRKSAHILNKPIGSCYLKYADTWGGFITISVGWRQAPSIALKPISHLILVKFQFCPKFRARNSTVGFKKTGTVRKTSVRFY
jgi:hypothetical protein